MKLARYSLQVQLLFAMLALLVVSNVAFAALIYFANLRFEKQLLESEITHEMNEYVVSLADTDAPLPQPAEVMLYRQNGERPVPPAFSRRAPGVYHAVESGGRYYQLAVRDLVGDRVYMAMDITDIRNQQLKLMILLGAGALIVPILGILAGLWFLRRIIRPVRSLAEEVSRLEPDRRHLRISPGFRGYEVEQIAHAFDRYLERMDEFVEREQSFSSAASHELRTPLSIISTSAELMEADRNLPANLREPLQRIRRATRGMASLISSLLFLTREKPATGDMEEQTELCDLLQRAADGFRLLIGNHPVTLSLHCDGSTTVPAPADHIGVVINNLLKNAVFHTKEGLISIHLKDGRVTITDSGSGIAPGDMENVFDREFRGRQSRGQGLGLYIAKRICDAYGWSLSLDSAPGRGTSAVVDFNTPDKQPLKS